jgi:ionotropic glutamate receptor
MFIVQATGVVYFQNILSTGVGILYKKKAPPPPNLFSFLSPFSIDVWIYTTTAYLATSILMFFMAR